MTISLGVKKVEERLQQDRDFSKRVESMEKNLRETSKKKYFIAIACPHLLYPLGNGAGRWGAPPGAPTSKYLCSRGENGPPARSKKRSGLMVFAGCPLASGPGKAWNSIAFTPTRRKMEVAPMKTLQFP